MTDLRQERLAERDKVDAEGLQRLATEQYGVVSSSQLQACGLTRAAMSRWVGSGRLHQVHPRVYALGHSSLSFPGRLTAALLYAGAGAVLSHTTAAWVWRLLDATPTRIHITVPGRRRSWADVRVHHSRQVSPIHCRGFPVTPAARTLLDLGATLSARQLRRALSQADYLGLLEAAKVHAVLKQGRPGSKALRLALPRHLPQLAETLSVLEERFLELCKSAGLPSPR